MFRFIPLWLYSLIVLFKNHITFIYLICITNLIHVLKRANIQAVTTLTVAADSLSSVHWERKWILMSKIETCKILLVTCEARSLSCLSLCHSLLMYWCICWCVWLKKAMISNISSVFYIMWGVCNRISPKWIQTHISDRN